MRKLKPLQIIQQVPDIQTVIPPKGWLDNLPVQSSVFNSFYKWMTDDGKVTVVNDSVIHNRTYVGASLYRKLVNAERKRIKKVHGLTESKLEDAVFWSDINSGPKTQIADCEISGDVALVIPEASEDALNSFASDIYKKNHESTVDKIRSTAAGSTFYEWLLSQTSRPDPIGDLATDAQADEEFPRTVSQFELIKSYLESQRASSNAITTLKEAWLEYFQQYPERIQSAAWCNSCGKKISIADAKLIYSEDWFELSIMDTQCYKEFENGEELKSYPLSTISALDLENLAEKQEISKVLIEEIEETLKLWGVIPITNHDGYIYFMMADETQKIKIGFTAGKVEDRLRSLQTGNASRLKVMAKIRGKKEYERVLHEKFSAFRLTGEWFDPHPDLLKFISLIKTN